MKLVELKKTKGRPQLWTYGMLSQHTDIHDEADQPQPLSADGESAAGIEPPAETEAQKKKEAARTAEEEKKRVSTYANRLKELVKQAKVSGNIATASLPVSQVFHTAITLPPVDTKEIDHHVRAKVSKMLPMPIEEMQVVHQMIPTAASLEGKKQEKVPYHRVLVTAAPKKLVSFYTKVFQEAGLQLDELETEAFALQRALVGTDPSTSMIIDMGAERTNFFIIDQTVPITHRSLQIGGNAFDTVIAEQLGVPVEKVGQIKKDLSRVSLGKIQTEGFMPLLNPILKEIQYHIEIFSRQTGNEQKRLEKIIFTGGASLFPPIIDTIKAAFPVNVFIGDPWARTVYQQGLKRVLDDIGPRMAVSIGLALRNIV